ncbi:MAG TPA: cytochrome c oxidase subunit 3 [Kofleriaceae bacterium]|nr:cytochrome c oxidase subunit 3 [Kofleriaceae bacterium]
MIEHAPQHAEARLEVQFEDLAKQEHAARFGMWVFLGSELLLFAGLFGLYTAYRATHSAEFGEAVHHNALWIGTTNTVILICSSFTVAWSIHAIRGGRERTTTLMLLLTMLFGTAFLVLKGVEYSQHFREGILPGRHYAFAELPGHGAQLFFTLYYFMTGLHAIHMIAGLGVMTWLVRRVIARRITRSSHTALELGGLYWHLVDGIWIFLWPLFYLATR